MCAFKKVIIGSALGDESEVGTLEIVVFSDMYYSKTCDRSILSFQQLPISDERVVIGEPHS